MAGEIILYVSEDGNSHIALKQIDGSVWLTQAEIAELFQTSVPNINQHIKAILLEDEQAEATIKPYLIVQTEGSRAVERAVAHYNLSMILSIGFRVRSARGMQFRRWASDALQEYLVKGFVMDDAKLKDPKADYFEELLSRIRDIRSSEKLFYRKVLDIFATSLDYDPKQETSERFFQTVQNKMHFATHGHTAAEIVHARANAAKDNMGLTNWSASGKGGSPTKRHSLIAKNYLEGKELETLNRIVTAYLEFAELQAMNRRGMYMAGWVQKLDEFLKLGDREVLSGAGQISAERAKQQAESEFALWSARIIDEPSAIESHFTAAIAKTKQIGSGRKN